MNKGFRKPNALQDLLRKIEVNEKTGCWETKTFKKKGYSTVRMKGHSRYFHRALYELLVAIVPSDLELDHLCRNRGCVNPAHLEPVTGAENVRRSPIHTGALNRSKTHCKRGHLLSEDNLILSVWLGKTRRGCKICHTVSVARGGLKRTQKRREQNTNNQTKEK